MIGHQGSKIQESQSSNKLRFYVGFRVLSSLLKLFKTFFVIKYTNIYHCNLAEEYSSVAHSSITLWMEPPLPSVSSHCHGALSFICLMNSSSSQTETPYPRNTNSSSPWYPPFFCLCEFSYKHLQQAESYRLCSFVTGLFH